MKGSTLILCAKIWLYNVGFECISGQYIYILFLPPFLVLFSHFKAFFANAEQVNNVRDE
jgi:hypothetical protein